MPQLMYYFSIADRRLRYGDSRPIVCGETHVVDIATRRLELCAYGLHASPTPFQALDYAPGPILWQVRLGGEVITGDDKSCASKRTYLAEFDATAVLRTFARRQALINIEKIRSCCIPSDYDLILTWLTTGDESLRSVAESAARYAAWSAAYADRSAAYAAYAAYAAESAAYAAESAARYAAWSAAWSADRSAARSAADAAAYAAKYAAESAADAAAYAAKYAAESAARSAAYAAQSAAWSAARSAASDMLTEMLREATGWEV